MNSEWPNVRLDELLTHHQKYIESPEPRVYPKLSVKLYGKGVVLDSPADGTTLKMKRHQLAKAGQVILSEIWGKKGAIGFVPPEGEGALCTSHFFLFNVRSDRLEPKWLQAIFDANYLQEQLDAEAKGTTGYAAVRPKILLACAIPLPPLAEQRRIVARIGELSAKVKEARDLRHQAAEEANALLDSITQQQLGKIGLSSKLDDGLFELIYRYPTFYDIDYTERGVGLLKIGNLTQDKWDIDFRTQRAFISQETSLKFPKTVLEEGDLIMAARGATIGKTAYVTAEFAQFNINANLLRLKPNRKKLDGRFFWYFMCSPLGQDQFQALVTSTAKETVTVPKLKTMLVPLPPLSEQRRLVAYLDRLQERVVGLRVLQDETSAELSAVMPSILDKAFRGEL